MKLGIGGDSGSSPEIIRYILFIAIGMLFINFAIFTWQVKFGKDDELQNQTFIFAERESHRQDIVWPALRLEKRLYNQEGYDLFWEDTHVAYLMKKVLSEYYMFFELLVLRCWGIFMNFPLFLFAVLFGVIEGRVSYKNKRVQFGNISSTKYHFAVKLGLFLLIAAISIYISFPAGVKVPFLGFRFPVAVKAFGVPIWLTSPMYWMMIISSISMLVAYNISANFSRDI